MRNSRTSRWQEDLKGRVDGLFLDLGVSSPQLDEARRGFSFRADGPLDMRMDPDSGFSAAEWLATVELRELRRVSVRIWRRAACGPDCTRHRPRAKEQPITTTGQLADLVASVAPRHGQKEHPATKTFQAIRIFVNQELKQLASALDASIECWPRRTALRHQFSLAGRSHCQAFHAQRVARAGAVRGMPDIPEDQRPPLRLVGKAIARMRMRLQ